MPTIRDQAIVLRRWDWSETSQTALLFCQEHGLLRGLAKGAKREKGRFSGGFEPLTLGEATAIVKHSTELATLTEWDLQEVFFGVRRSGRAFRVGHYFAELVCRGVHDADPHPALWAALAASLRALDAPADAELTLAGFQWALLEETGYRPDLSATGGVGAEVHKRCATAGTFLYDPKRGSLVNEPSDATQRGGWRIRAQTLAFLQTLGAGSTPRSDPHCLPDRQAASETIERANRFLAACILWSLGEEPRTMRLVFEGSVFGSSHPARSRPGGDGG